MTNPDKKLWLDLCLERAAEQLGDINPLVMQRFYANYPQARDLFSVHAGELAASLENYMVESALYCLMTWFERPVEVEVIINSTVPHHASLQIPVPLFLGLMQTVIDVIGESLPGTDREAAAVWQEVGHGMRVLIEQAARE